MRAELFWIDPGRLAVLPRPRGGDWLEDEIRSLRVCGVDVLVSLLTGEETAELDLTGERACCAVCGIEFVSFAIADRGIPPSAADVLGLVRRLEDRLASGKAVAIHCRQGVGRSALVAACILTSRGEAADAALERIGKARGCPVPDTAEQKAWLLQFAERHLNSLEHGGPGLSEDLSSRNE